MLGPIKDVVGIYSYYFGFQEFTTHILQHNTTTSTHKRHLIILILYTSIYSKKMLIKILKKELKRK